MVKEGEFGLAISGNDVAWSTLRAEARQGRRQGGKVVSPTLGASVPPSRAAEAAGWAARLRHLRWLLRLA